MEERFFIFDCNDNIVGNPKGYRTMRGAMQQQNQRNSPAKLAIWQAYYEKKKLDPSATDVSSIRLGKDL